MLFPLAANLLVLLHFAFILFVVFGGLLVLRRRSLAWLHLPATVWGVLIEFSGWVCPLTPLENYFRQWAGEVGYSGGFVEEYLLPIIYPAELTRELQVGIGAGVLLINLFVYGIFLSRRQTAKRNQDRPWK